jgi:four helix bundle protein
MHNFKELKIWQKARVFVKEVYLLTQKFPAEEKFGLISQIRRAAVSLISNIAEGSGRNSKSDFSHFVDMANGSAFEVETQLYIALDLGYCSQQEFDTLILDLREIEKMIFNLRQFLSK